jgi:hypothetical protein
MELNADALIERPENAALFKTMKQEHPDIPEYLLKNALAFYLTDCIKFDGNRKKRGRKPKPPPVVSEIKGAVTIK